MLGMSHERLPKSNFAYPKCLNELCFLVFVILYTKNFAFHSVRECLEFGFDYFNRSID